MILSYAAQLLFSSHLSPCFKKSPNQQCLACATSAPNAAPKRPRNHYKNLSIVHQEILEFTNGENRMPSSSELRKHNYRHLENAVTRHGGFVTVAKKLGLERSKKNGRPCERWEWEKVVQEVEGFMRLHGDAGVMPTRRSLRENGKASLAFAIERFGGFANVAEKLGLKRVGGRRRGWWKEWKNLETELRSFLHAGEERESYGNYNGEGRKAVQLAGQEGTMPTQRELREAGRVDMAEAIQKYHGGFAAVAKRMGLASRLKEKDYWRHFHNLAKELYCYVDQEGRGAVMPSQEELRRSGRMDLIAAIFRHRGMSTVAERLGLNYKGRIQEPLRNWTFFRRLLLGFIERHGTPGALPTQRELLNFNQSELYKAVLYHGGPREVAERMNLRTVKFLNDFATVGKSVLDFVEKHGTPGEMPSEQDFRDIGRNTLSVAVSKFSYSQVAWRLGLREREPQQQALDTIVSATISASDSDKELLADVAEAHLSLSDIV